LFILSSGRDLALSIYDLWLSLRGKESLNYLEVRYEGLIRELEEVLRRIGQFMGLRFDTKGASGAAHGFRPNVGMSCEKKEATMPYDGASDR
jgi:hypothetical protein